MTFIPFQLTWNLKKSAIVSSIISEQTKQRQSGSTRGRPFLSGRDVSALGPNLGYLNLFTFFEVGADWCIRACLETSAFIDTRRHVDKKGLCAAAKTREDWQTIPQRSDGQRMGACTSSPAPCFRRRSEAQNRPA